MTPDTLQQFQQAVAAALASNPDATRYLGTNAVESVINAYTTGDWSNVVSLSGLPFTREQQQAAVSAAEKALAPAYRAQETYDTAGVTDSLQQDRQGYEQFKKDEADAFGDAKDTQDLNAADNGILFSGSRVQKLNDLRKTYEERDALKRGQVSSKIGTTARDYQYKYGDQNARKLRDLYTLPGQSTFNPNVAGGKVTTGGGLSSVYNPKSYSFQGTAPVSQKAAVQTRAASLLTNRANKLSPTGYKSQF